MFFLFVFKHKNNENKIFSRTFQDKMGKLMSAIESKIVLK